MSWLDAFLQGAPGPAGPTGPAGPVGSVGASLPITSTGGTAPVIGINAATDSLPGSMSAADKTKLDAATSSSTASTLALRGADGSLSGQLLKATTPVSTPSAPATGWTVYVDTADGQLKAINAAGQISNLTGAMGFTVTNSKTLNANNTTATVAPFQVTGAVLVKRLFAVVTTQLGPNHTGDKFFWSDSATVGDISPATSTAMNMAPVGSMLSVSALSGSIETLAEPNGVEAVLAATANDEVFQQFKLVAKSSGAGTYIEHQYTTTDTPTSGVMFYVCVYEPLSTGATITAV